jgi:hypothetical protein
MQPSALDLTCRRITCRTDNLIECRFLPGRPRERLERWERCRHDARLTREDWFLQVHADGTLETVWYAARNENIHCLDGELWDLTTSRALNPWR